jgi:putative ABC transport system permease protein
MGIQDPIGKRLYQSNREGLIIGVVKDFNFHRLTRPIDPLILAIEPGRFEEIVIRINPANTEKIIDNIEKTWKAYYPGEPFEYQFLDEEFDRMYRAEERMGRIFNYFAVLAILISCMGLFGLASFIAELRTREIGIRKAHGSSVLNIFLLMNRPFVLWVLISNLIASPIAWYAMTRWLENYAYKTSISWWIFVVSILLSLIIAILTVTFQALRKANTNPAEILRYE